MSVFFDQIKNLNNASELKLVSSEKSTSYQFEYDGLNFSATQKIIEGLTLSKVIFALKSEKLFQVANKEQILDEINKFNKRVSTLKVVLDKIEDENIYMRFSVEFGIEDSIFKQINFKDLIKLLLASSKLFMSKFLNEESNAVGKLFNE